MTTACIIFFLIIQVIHFLGTWKLYQKAGRQMWEAAVPVYNAYVLTKIINRPWWWVILLFLPIVNLMMFPAFWVETARSFGKEKTGDLVLVVLTLGFYLFVLNYDDKTQYNAGRQLKPYTTAGEWVTSIVFAVIAATIIHTYFIRPYNIPTSSLEKTLLVGDFLFVSKMHYGALTPQTPLSIPMFHDSIPIPLAGKRAKSYVSKVQMPSFRLPGFQKVKANDIVVFYWPVDTVRYFRDHSGIHVQKPVDKKSNYVKRCVAVAGDSLEIKSGDVYINGVKQDYPVRAKLQYNYVVDTKVQFTDQLLAELGHTEYKYVYSFPYNLYKQFEVNGYIDKSWVLSESVNDSTNVILSFPEKISVEGMHARGIKLVNDKMVINMTEDEAESLAKRRNIVSVTKHLDSSRDYRPNIFPHDPLYKWNVDHYGPIYIPKKGETVAITPRTIPFYKRIIEEYEKEEGHEVVVNVDEVMIDGTPIETYTFKQNYYWMMGDNRQNSEDSRFWGYVPYDHIVGKPVLIWWSIERFNPNNPKSYFQRIRWNRMFTTVKGSGKPVSYLPYVLIGIVLITGYSLVKKRKNKA